MLPEPLELALLQARVEAWAADFERDFADLVEKDGTRGRPSSKRPMRWATAPV